MTRESGADRPTGDPLFALVRGILFEMDPERAHDVALRAMDNHLLQRWLTRRYATTAQPNSPVIDPVMAMGMPFDNAVGLAAGLDKNGDHIDALGALGFGHIEVGTVTPRPQAGNPKPRLFRLTLERALINRMGFNNKGVDHLVEQVSKRRWAGRIGINIGKNASTPLENADDDYVHCLEKVAAIADYVTVNISSPNTSGLRDLQHGDSLNRLLLRLKDTQSALATRHGSYTPIAVKIAPDLDSSELDAFCQSAIDHEIDAVISGNTTRERTSVTNHLYAREAGGLSGTPLRPLAERKLADVHQALAGRTCLIGVGGIDSGSAAARKLELGATLVQLYTGFIFHGPALIRDCIQTCQPSHTPTGRT